MYLGSMPKPKATTSAGAMATTGVTMITTISGITAFSTIGSSLITTARRKPQRMPAPAPTTTSWQVTSRLAQYICGSLARLLPMASSVGST